MSGTVGEDNLFRAGALCRRVSVALANEQWCDLHVLVRIAKRRLYRRWFGSRSIKCAIELAWWKSWMPRSSTEAAN
jgi:hypothetical protein